MTDTPEPSGDYAVALLHAKLVDAEMESNRRLRLLRALAEYVGGCDTHRGHPAREAWEYLLALDSER